MNQFAHQVPTRNCCNKRGELIKGGNYCNKRGEASPSAQAGGGARIWRSRAVRVVGPTPRPLRARGAPQDLIYSCTLYLDLVQYIIDNDLAREGLAIGPKRLEDLLVNTPDDGREWSILALIPLVAARSSCCRLTTFPIILVYVRGEYHYLCTIILLVHYVWVLHASCVTSCVVTRC